MDTGTIKFYNSDKGFGIINHDNGGEELMFHFSEIRPAGAQIDDGQKVQYDAITNSKGAKLNAANVSAIGSNAGEDPPITIIGV
jgi:CspA family cold shock protein